jgi:hypothetical protein
METLEKCYNAQFVYPDEAIWTGPSDRPKSIKFTESAFYQMLKRDRGNYISVLLEHKILN